MTTTPSTTAESLATDCGTHPTVTVTHAALAAALTDLAPAFPRGIRWATGAILAQASDDTLTLTAVSDDATIRVTLPSTAATPGVGLIPFVDVRSILTAAAKGTPRAALATAPVTLTLSPCWETTDDNVVGTITAGGFTVPLNGAGLDIAKFPAIPSPAGCDLLVDRATLRDALSRVMTTCSTDTTLPALCGVNVRIEDGTLRLSSSDRYRLSAESVPYTGTLPDGAPTDVTIAAAPLLALLKSGAGDDVALGSAASAPGQPSTLTAHSGVTTTTMTSLTDSYPPLYALLKGAHDARALAITVDRGALVKTLTRAAAMGKAAARSDCTLALVFDRTSGTIRVDFTMDGGRAQGPGLPAAYTALTEDDTVAEVVFTPEFLLDAVQVFTTDELTIVLASRDTTPSGRARLSSALFLGGGAQDLGDIDAHRHLLVPRNPAT